MSHDSVFPLAPAATRPVPRAERIRLEPKRRDAEVISVEDVSPHFRRIRFGGPELAEFNSPAFDDHVKFIFAGDMASARNYTPRAYDNAAGTVDIEFALHGHGPAAAWAAQATPGQQAVIAGPRGAFVIPKELDWHLLIGDASALPAIARRLEELPTSTQALVIVQLDDAADRRDLPSAARTDIHWLGAEHDPVAALRALTIPAGSGYAWCAGEAAGMAALRKVLIEEKHIDKHAIRSSAYWKRGSSAHHEHLEE